ncbi:hypothetical protein M3P21_22200 [Ruegeria sp. 2012CJ41-6]|uniref:Baseplate structural protein Gp10 C-terminal domain-containing protein n=1 Tax=Ruegeria spongiae TaxID=2942209 RepID=A0ABT0Q8R3_9RHOB|nr:hypothetical protein [Ruegeria spongiae]MCL6286207.1 hypothetical protein [Ruegeria spongiae]
MVENEEPSEKRILEILTEDIQAHRDYVQRLYRNAFYVGGIGLAAGVGLAIWVLGERLDSSILQHRIDEKLVAKVNLLTDDRVGDAEAEISKAAIAATSDAKIEIEAAANSAKKDARDDVDKYLKERLTADLAELVKPQLEVIAEASASDLAAVVTLPRGLVAAFDSNEGCPLGWSVFEDGGGRTIVGAGEHRNEGENGRRLLTHPVGQTGGAELHVLTLNEMPSHRHEVVWINSRGDQSVSLNGSSVDVANDDQFHIASFREGGQANRNVGTTAVGGSAPHNNMPPYIALYFCKKE